jgi:hypothetical protein
MAMLLRAINQAALVKSTDNSGNSCNMRASEVGSPFGFSRFNLFAHAGGDGSWLQYDSAFLQHKRGYPGFVVIHCSHDQLLRGPSFHSLVASGQPEYGIC